MNLIETPYQLNEKEKHAARVFHFENTDIMNLQIKAGGVIPEHSSDCDVVVIVRKGKVLFNVEGEEMELTNEKVLYMTPLEKHGLTAIEDSDILVMKIGRKGM